VATGEGPAGVDDLVPRHDPDWVVLDGYGLGTEVQTHVRELGPRLAVVDDHAGHGRYDADVVVDQNLPVTERRHHVPSGSALLAGPRYALMRSEFATVKCSAPAERPLVVVTLGGFAADQAEELCDSLAVGLDAAGASAEVTTPARAGATDAMAELLARATVVVSAAGTTAWELASLGRPALLVTVAENQGPVAAGLARTGAAVDLGPLDGLSGDRLLAAVTDLLDDPLRRDALGARGRALVDGRGAPRVVTELRSDLVELRPFRPEDARVVWEWANDPQVRASAFSPEPIAWDDHRRWFEAGLHDPRSRRYLAATDGTAWGQIRFDEAGAGSALIDVSVARTARGRGLAAPLVRAGVRRVFEESDLRVVRAEVRADNEPSVRAFLAADFDRDDRASTAGVQVLTYARGRDGRG
jgi:spore coat polysaccharide biosynthesis predicted glycosyltransferase SpsG/RimJ/RimL family protein N-acetyltransferase